MMEEDGCVPVPVSVIYFDGENDINVGIFMVDSSFDFKIFQSVISQKIGISPDQFSIHLISFGSNHKIPINGNVNFAVASEKDTFFFVKRSKWSSKNNTQNGYPHAEYDPPIKVGKSNKNCQPENVILLRRRPGSDEKPFTEHKAPILDRVEYERRVRKFQIERERYLHNMGLNDLSLERGSDGGNEGKAKGGDVICKVCSRAKQRGMDVGFHVCAHDAVTMWFRTSAGPITRPNRRSG